MGRFFAPLVAALLALVCAVPALAAKPPVPDGSKPIPAGHLPAACTQADTGASAYGSTFGYAYDSDAKQWVSAPRCFPKWGNLVMSGSQMTNAGSSATFTATPTDGSNSADYAPESKSIAWTYGSAKVVSGCGNADLSCTIIPAKNATDSYQWVEVHVSMPRTFFVDSPGSNCAGQHLCAGVSTQAWAFAGVRPEDATPATITGRVVDPDGEAMPGVKIAAAGPASKSGMTDAAGRYELKVAKKGSYTVKATNGDGAFSPSTAKVVARKGKAATANFKLVGCKAKSSKTHTFNYAGGGATGSASFDDCSQNVTATWTRSVPCTDRAGAPAAPVTVTAAWGEELKPALKAGSSAGGRQFGSPSRISRVVTVSGQTADETFSNPLVKIGTGSIRGTAMRFGVLANVSSGQRVCTLDVAAESLFSSQ